MKDWNITFPEKCKYCGEKCLEQIDFLQGLPPERLQLIMDTAARGNYQKGSVLFREGDPVDAIHVIHEGKVKLSCYDSEGREQIVGGFSDGDTIWEGIFMDDSYYPYDAVCLTDVRTCRIARTDMEEIMKDPMISMRIVGLLSRKLHDANERNVLLSTSSPKTRLAGFLLYRSRHTAGDTITMKLDDIAASINLRPETVSRRIKDLEKDGLVRRTGQSGIQILDAEALGEIE